MKNTRNFESFAVEGRFVLLEAGCGVGNTIFPLLRQPNLKNLFIYGFDVSETAVKITQESEFYDIQR
jgi:tRNAThr (cytosine32-N3)-methyltransferase